MISGHNAVNRAARAEAPARGEDERRGRTEVFEILKSYFCSGFFQFYVQDSPAESAFQLWFAEQRMKVMAYLPPVTLA